MKNYLFIISLLLISINLFASNEHPSSSKLKVTTKIKIEVLDSDKNILSGYNESGEIYFFADDSYDSFISVSAFDNYHNDFNNITLFEGNHFNVIWRLIPNTDLQMEAKFYSLSIYVNGKELIKHIGKMTKDNTTEASFSGGFLRFSYKDGNFVHEL